jgi:hypothetical protein
MFRKYFRALTHFCIPHEHNGFKPHVFRELSVSLIAVLAVLVFAGTLIGGNLIKQTSLGAAIDSLFLVDLTNKNRDTLHVPTLTVNPLLTLAAERKAKDMVARGYFAHNSPDGKSPWYWFKSVGYQFQYAGENLAVDFVDSEDVETAWMNSPGHRANIVNSNFTEIGIAIATGTFEGHSSVFVVQLFGKPAPKRDSDTANGSIILGSTGTSSVRTGTTTAVLGTQIVKKNVGTSTVLASTKKPLQPVVKGSEIEVVAPLGRTVLAQNDLFIAVAAEGEGVSLVSDSNTKTTRGQGEVFSWLERAIANPGRTAQWFYLFIAFTISLLLLIFVFVKFDHQHPRHLVYGILLLLLLFGLYVTIGMTTSLSVKIV